MNTNITREKPLVPFFVIGSPRSGTTLLRLLLTSHPQIVIPPECGFVTWLYPAFGAWQIHEFSDSENIARFVAAVATSRKFETWGLSQKQIENTLKHNQPCNYGNACASIYRLYCTRAKKPSAMWGDKNNYYLKEIDTLKAIFPEARFIHIVRDGRDIACSYREVMVIKTNSPYRPRLPLAIQEIAMQWVKDIRTIRESFAAMHPDITYDLRYEDLVNDPQAELTRLCNWLNQPFSPEMLQFHNLNLIYSLEPAATMDWKQRTLEPISADTVGKYIALLNKEEIAEFTDIAFTELQRYRYIGHAPQKT